jgi:hypothetical protein
MESVMFSLNLIVVLILFICIFVWWCLFMRQRYYLFPKKSTGARFFYDKKNKELRLISRLINSPVGAAGVPNNVLVTFLGHTNVSEMTEKDLNSFFSQNSNSFLFVYSCPKTGRNIDVIIEKKVMWAKVPVYELSPPESSPSNKNVHTSVEWCNLTGQYYFGGRLTKGALKEAYF